MIAKIEMHLVDDDLPSGDNLLLIMNDGAIKIGNVSGGSGRIIESEMREDIDYDGYRGWFTVNEVYAWGHLGDIVI